MLDWCIPSVCSTLSQKRGKSVTINGRQSFVVEEKMNINEIEYSVSDVRVKSQLISETTSLLYDGWM